MILRKFAQPISPNARKSSFEDLRTINAKRKKKAQARWTLISKLKRRKSHDKIPAERVNFERSE